MALSPHPTSDRGTALAVPLSVIVVFLYVGALRLGSLLWAVSFPYDPGSELGRWLTGGPPMGLVNTVMAVNLLMAAWLWLDYRARVPRAGRRRGIATAAYIGAGLLLLYVGFATWEMARLQMPG